MNVSRRSIVRWTAGSAVCAAFAPDAFAGMEVHINVVSIGEEQHEAAEKV